MEKLINNQVCIVCNINKTFSEYHKNKRNKYGFQYKCKICTRQYKINYDNSNKNKIKEYGKKYYEDNRSKIINHNTNYYNDKIKNDLIFKFKNNIRALIRNSINYKGYSKTTRTYEILGCDYNALLNHLNDNKYGFKYQDNIYDIDHITPLSSAKTEEEVVALNHYTNLQLLPSEFNRYIKKDKVMTLEEIDTELVNWLGKNTYK